VLAVLAALLHGHAAYDGCVASKDAAFDPLGAKQAGQHPERSISIPRASVIAASQAPR